MIRLQPSLLAGLTGPTIEVSAIQTALQQAIELEHSTIPPYLYALYSLYGSTNQTIAGIIQSVVVEEMLHMTLASNVMNAIGGSPMLDQPGFIPTYPGTLPGGVDHELIVGLAPFSLNQLTAFLQIEEPASPVNYPPDASAPPSEGISIGQFYTAISNAIGTLGAGIFVNPPRNQVGPDLMPGAVVVTDVTSAQSAIQVIIDQGEGTTTTPTEIYGHGYAHYYRYMQIEQQALLEPATANPPGYTYNGDAVPFAAADVYAVPTNPGVPPEVNPTWSSMYAPGSAQAFANNNFNYTYTSLLLALHTMFNGQAAQAQFNRAFGLMMSLEEQAKAMMSGAANPAVLTGPSFQYQPTNPLNAGS